VAQSSLTTIEDIILQQDKRGVSALRPHMASDFCDRAARYVMEHPGNIAITTGFYILSAGKPETDGPPGAIAIGKALQSLGRKVSYIGDEICNPVMRELLGGDAEVLGFPIADVESSRAAAKEMLSQLDLSLIVSIERCGRTSNDAYLNMRSLDITPQTARLDYLFEFGVPSVGIGDGGNEIGMGNLVEFIPAVDTLPDDPAVTKVDRLIISSVSNWGGYGLVAALSRLAGRDLLPDLEEETRLIERAVDLGAVDGTTGEQKYYVDGFTTEENGRVLEQLRRWVDGAIG
jgi:hypothetical protein